MESLLDNDLYKLTMMQAVWQMHPDTKARYRFINRRDQDRFTPECLERVQAQIRKSADLQLHPEEANWLRTLPYLQDEFVHYLEQFQLQDDTIDLQLDAEGRLTMVVEGPWVETILWEVPLLAILSESYFQTVDRDWDPDMARYEEAAHRKAQRLTEAGCRFVDFGTRRRRSYATQAAVMRAFTRANVQCGGTSNAHFARLHDVKPVGTMAHEWIMAQCAFGPVESANARALREWRRVYGDQLGVALTDTYTTELFLRNFRGDFARDYAAVRHDSGDPIAFGERIIRFYQEEGIDPAQKAIVFSDSLNVDRAIEIQETLGDRIGVSFGIGTHFTNDFPGSRALNIVIKIEAVDERPVVKISDDRGKASGAPDAVRAALQAIDAALDGTD